MLGINNIRILDFLSGKKVWDLYIEYRDTQWYSKKQMEEYQINKLIKLLRHCKENVPYYSSIIKSKNIDIENIKSLDVLKDFPILTKEIIKENYNDFIPKNIKEIRGVKTSQTGGTTGSILYKRTDANTRSATWATFNRFHDWMGIKNKNKILKLMGGHVVKFSLKDAAVSKLDDFLSNTISYNPYDKSDKNLNRIIKALKTKKIFAIRGYSQGLFFIAKMLKIYNLKFDITSITTTAEPLMDEHREVFKEIFGADSYDQYGCGEIGGVAYECNHHNGLHVAEERVILEFQDNYDLLITDLDNYAMPYIRYWNADQAVVSNNKCSCGRESVLLKKIMGRTCDYISGKDGKQLHWAYFWHLLFDTKIAAKRNMIKFQVAQRSLEEIDFRIVSDPLTSEDKSIIENNMRKFLGKEIGINFIQESDIENADSGKYRPVINDII